MKNLKISRNVKALVLVDIVFTSVGLTKVSFDSEEDNFRQAKSINCIYDKNSIENFNFTDEYISYARSHNLVSLDSFRSNIKTKKQYVKKRVVTDIKHTDEGLKFIIDNKILSTEEEKDYIGLVNYSDEIKYKLYKVDFDGKEFESKKVITDTLNVEGKYFIDPDDYIQLVNPQEGYYINGKIRTKE